MGYKNILNVQYEQYSKYYKQLNKQMPYLSKDDKCIKALDKMKEDRFDIGLKGVDLSDIKGWAHAVQYHAEMDCLYSDILGQVTRYYVNDEELFDFFKTTLLKSKEIDSVLGELTEDYYIFGLLGKTQSYTIHFVKIKDADGVKINQYVCTVLSDKENNTFVPQWLTDETRKSESGVNFRLAMNFLFYYKAFPECIVDGVPNTVKKSSNAKVLKTSEKIISHTTTERGYIKPHFKVGYFRHFKSDYFVNCKGQVRFIAPTMVKGKAKTVLSVKEK